MVSLFAQKVYEQLCMVPPGRVITYKGLANAIGTNAYRAVGQALRANPFAPKVPCHRVVASDGDIGGFGGKTKGAKVKEKIALLKREGIIVERCRVEDFEEKKFVF